MIALYDSKNAKPDPDDPNRLIGVLAYSARFYTPAEIERAKAEGRDVWQRLVPDRALGEFHLKFGVSWHWLDQGLRRLEHRKRILQRDLARRRRRGEAIHDSWNGPEARQFLGRRHDPHGQHRHLAVVEVR